MNMTYRLARLNFQFSLSQELRFHVKCRNHMFSFAETAVSYQCPRVETRFACALWIELVPSDMFCFPL